MTEQEIAQSCIGKTIKNIYIDDPEIDIVFTDDSYISLEGVRHEEIEGIKLSSGPNYSTYL